MIPEGIETGVRWLVIAAWAWSLRWVALALLVGWLISG